MHVAWNNVHVWYGLSVSLTTMAKDVDTDIMVLRYMLNALV